jgi:outer membrane protein OmpA-like peptidoglycan-associated protein
MAKHNVWMSVSDLMTGLMIIFLFIAIAYISRVKKNQTVLTDFVDVKTQLHDKLIDKFQSDTARWQMTIGRDLNMTFTNPNVLFKTGSYDLTPEFKVILDEFLPKYFDILVKDTMFRHQIKEIRIEGHTDNVPAPQFHKDPYIANAILSQLRSVSVLWHFRTMPAFAKYSDEERKMIEFWLTANGLSYGRALDADGNFCYESGKPINLDKSRRVEFRIVTSGEDVLEDFVKHNR